MTNEELWQAALGEIELNLSKANFITWFKNTGVLEKKDGFATISVPNGFSKEWLSNKYQKLILKSLRNLSPDIKNVDFVISTTLSSSQIIPSSPNISIQKYTEKQPQLENQAGFEEFKVNKDTNLNPKYTFDSFVVGSFNELAQAAAKAVVQNLGTLYNPLFIYGGVGLGKTHLLQAIGNEVIDQNKKRVKYTSSERFSSELIYSLREGKIDRFKEEYRKIDVLIIDDIQFLAGKEKTQEEFFHIFNALYQKNKQIILSSDRPPKAIATLEERLRSRFEGGMTADISYPDFETRLVIIKTKADEKKYCLPEDVLEYIATNIKKNIRELEGALNRVMAFVQINNTPPSIDDTAKILSSVIAPPRKLISYKNIIKAVSEFYDITTSDLTTKCRRREIVWPRQITMFLMREELKNSYPFIGEKLGGKDHTTVMYACEKLNKEIETNETVQQEINLIKERIYNTL
ncbi:MAG: chromosomal replication initiator protein DnaA [Candidatus Portnoybacteria bacterium CG09_land_8_20_14_0_10_44_13]|uniref:Chromosomal replication initiator protein DnaA n=3 Tax=Parcubacteria group TaxID=1794811 RepID=A0A2H0WWN8_9BACT|nr:MAG: chromosomal replication initiator protein DnaA [Candidatus Nealsonbacteria bacterium CG11_big_fil_rev_8_21_14_0_20_35_11]PIS16358.1 MAG: chromosomal replication initiator protein DnaA [Candidatus Portnoybacteria bacterium CG09_land_8_20_14_0_10_44_13]PIZ70985.1 MAG: chromosomal replication initiator protein DnaA [Candidatus Portnoybacteria bacterium CG_4_10_14_0_2_um_filter_44_20]